MSCIVDLCKNRSDRGRKEGVKMLRLPRDPKQAELWLKAVHRLELLKNERYKNSKICNQHFTTGMPSRDPEHPDYVPSIFPYVSDEQRLVIQRKRAERLEVFDPSDPDYKINQQRLQKLIRQQGQKRRQQKGQKPGLQQSQKPGQQQSQKPGQPQVHLPPPPEKTQQPQSRDLLLHLPGAMNGQLPGELFVRVPNQNLQGQQPGGQQGNKAPRRLIVVINRLPEGSTAQAVQKDNEIPADGEDNATVDHDGDHTYSKDPQSAPVEPELEETETQEQPQEPDKETHQQRQNQTQKSSNQTGLGRKNKNSSPKKPLTPVAVQDSQNKPKEGQKSKENPKPLLCPICGVYFWCVLRFATHVQKHADEQVICKICDKTLPHKTALDFHSLTHSKEETFRLKSSQQEQVNKNQSTEESFSCPHCDESFSCKKSRQDHVKQNHPSEESLICPVCGVSFRVKTTLQQHMKQHAATSECSYCGQKFREQKALDLHLLRHQWRMAREAEAPEPVSPENPSVAKSSPKPSVSKPTASKKKKLQQTLNTDPGQDKVNLSVDKTVSKAKRSSKPSVSKPKASKKKKLQQTANTDPGPDQRPTPTDQDQENLSVDQTAPDTNSSSCNPPLTTMSTTETTGPQQTLSTDPGPDQGQTLTQPGPGSFSGVVLSPLVFISGPEGTSIPALLTPGGQNGVGGSWVLSPVSNAPPNNPAPNNPAPKNPAPKQISGYPKPHKCPLCEKWFRHKYRLREHLGLHRGERPLQCSHCPQRFSSKASMRMHIRYFHIEGKPHQCSFCDRKFRDKSVLKEHMEAKHTEKTVKCPVCGKMFASVQRMENHAVQHTRSRIRSVRGNSVRGKRKPYSCSVCFQAFETSETAEEHLEIHKREIEAKKSLGETVEQRDIKVNFSEPQFLCSECGKTFYQKGNLDMHVRGVHSQGQPFHCSICDADFKQKLTFTMHMRIHKEDKPYSCSVCPQSFRLKLSLTVHMRTHSGEKPFACTVCGKRFSVKPALKAHAEMHEEGEPIPCTMCNKKFKRLKLLEFHLREKHRVGDFSCSICQKTFLTDTSLKIHKAHHLIRWNYKRRTRDTGRETEARDSERGTENWETEREIEIWDTEGESETAADTVSKINLQ